MITPETPHKLAEIIRDTWPQLFSPRGPLIEIPREENRLDNRTHDNNQLV